MPIKILVVEDEGDLEFLLTRKFREKIRAGELQFLFARNGVEALQQLAAEPDVPVVLSDIRMPEMDGLTLLSHLNERYPLLRTIIISAYTDMRNIRAAMNRGAYDFLTKPIDFEDLELTLAKTIQHVEQLRHEVAERKKTEAELVRLKKAVENMRLGVTVTDLEGKILYANPAEARMHGYLATDLLGQDAAVFAPPECRRPMTLAQVKQWHGSIRESVNIRKDGSTFPVWLMSDLVKGADGAPIAVVTSCEDITAQKAAAAELKRHQDHLEELVKARTNELQAKNVELQLSNAAKDKFFSIIAHDLRSPFTTLLGFTEHLENNLEQYHPQELKHYLKRIHASAEKLYALLENLLTWARLQQGAIKCRPEVINLSEAATENLALFLPRAEQKGLELRNSIPAHATAYADYTMVATILRNLVSNALKFTDAGGQVSVSANAQDHLVEIAVTDTGGGIPPEGLARLFRIDATYTGLGTAGEQGTGLGLILCKELVEQQGGRIWVESAVGQGTSFRFTIPLAK